MAGAEAGAAELATAGVVTVELEGIGVGDLGFSKASTCPGLHGEQGLHRLPADSSAKFGSWNPGDRVL